MTLSTLETSSRHACFGGEVSFHNHASTSTRTPMRFSVYTPPQARHSRVPVLYFLAGLTCTEETFMIKAGAQRVAAELGLMLVAPDTSPRGIELPGDRDTWDFGVAAGFYIDATQAPWSGHYRMETYVTRELPALIAREFPCDPARVGIFGHSMGGHGALTLGLKYPDLYRSISAFAPISAPSQVPWGRKAFSHYFGSDEAAWKRHDAVALIEGLRDHSGRPEILVDQGLGDMWLTEQLRPQLLEAAARISGYPLTVRRHEGYDHGYYFISTFIEEHLRHHAGVL
jgi:S-formylglutathione hydrolase